MENIVTGTVKIKRNDENPFVCKVFLIQDHRKTSK